MNHEIRMSAHEERRREHSRRFRVRQLALDHYAALRGPVAGEAMLPPRPGTVADFIAAQVEEMILR